jgi:outer membrane protein OmpA-like peptidoglycan-associated protein
MFPIHLKIFTANLIALSMVLAGCQTSVPDSGEKIISNAVKVADSNPVIGAYMDSQEVALRQSLVNSGVSVQRQGDAINLIMPGKITFATNQSDIQTDFYLVLDSVVKVLAGYDKTAIEIEGHTDSSGGLSYNLSLSQNRAMQVANYLKSKGIKSKRILHFGKGPMRPIANNQSAEGRAQNRRVEIKIKAITS